MTDREKALIVISVTTRIRHIEKLIHDWDKCEDETSQYLVEIYNEEKTELQELRDNIANQ